MARSLSNLFDNLAEGIPKIKCKLIKLLIMLDWINQTWRIKCKDCESCLEYSNVRDDLIEYKNTNIYVLTRITKKVCNLDITKKFSNLDINKFILLFLKGVYHINAWMFWKKSMKHRYTYTESMVTKSETAISVKDDN